MNSKAFLSEAFSLLPRFQREPSTIAGVVRHIGETAQAFAGDAVVDALGEHPVLHHAHAAAGMEPHAFALARSARGSRRCGRSARRLPRGSRRRSRPTGSAARARGPDPRCRGARQPEELLDASRLRHAEAPPRLDVVAHGRVHAIFSFEGLKPGAVEGDEVLRVYLSEARRARLSQGFQGVVHMGAHLLALAGAYIAYVGIILRANGSGFPPAFLKWADLWVSPFRCDSGRTFGRAAGGARLAERRKPLTESLQPSNELRSTENTL